MPKTAKRPAQLTGKIFQGRSAVSRGLLTPADLRSTAWQTLFRGIYADARIAITHRHRCVAVGQLLLPPGGAIAGRSAALLHGVDHAAGDRDPVDVLVPREVKFRNRGLRIHLGETPAADLCLHAGFPVTTPLRTCWDLARWLDVVEAVAIIDSLVAGCMVTVEELEAFARARIDSRGWRRLLRVAALVDGGAQSPQESRLRVRLRLAGVPHPATQYVIGHLGDFVARVDLAWPDRRVAVEYDGLWHAGSGWQIHADRKRLNRLTAAGWVVLHVTATRLREDFAGFLAELRTLLRSR